MVMYIIVRGFDFGLMKKHENNALKGDLFTSGGEEFEKAINVFYESMQKILDILNEGGSNE